jgi:hypothetical protein
MLRHGEGPDAHSSPSPATVKLELCFFRKSSTSLFALGWLIDESIEQEKRRFESN